MAALSPELTDGGQGEREAGDTVWVVLRGLYSAGLCCPETRGHHCPGSGGTLERGRGLPPEPQGVAWAPPPTLEALYQVHIEWTLPTQCHLKKQTPASSCHQGPRSPEASPGNCVVRGVRTSGSLGLTRATPGRASACHPMSTRGPQPTTQEEHLHPSPTRPSAAHSQPDRATGYPGRWGEDRADTRFT